MLSPSAFQEWIARREDSSNKRRLLRIILVGQRRGSFYDSQEYCKVVAYGYVFTYPAHSMPYGMEWVLVFT